MIIYSFDPQAYKQTLTPTVVQGGVDGNPPLGFRYITILQYKLLPIEENL